MHPKFPKNNVKNPEPVPASTTFQPGEHPVIDTIKPKSLGRIICGPLFAFFRKSIILGLTTVKLSLPIFIFDPNFLPINFLKSVVPNSQLNLIGLIK